MGYHLKQRGVKAVYYHGQLDLFEKNKNASMWLEGCSDVICTTNALDVYQRASCYSDFKTGESSLST